MNLMRIGGALTILVLGGAILWMVKRGPHPQVGEESQEKHEIHG
jgi:hypothetical protein